MGETPNSSGVAVKKDKTSAGSRSGETRTNSEKKSRSQSPVRKPRCYLFASECVKNGGRGVGLPAGRSGPANCNPADAPTPGLPVCGNHISHSGTVRVMMMPSQVRNTALQFRDVDEVVILPEDLFQP